MEVTVRFPHVFDYCADNKSELNDNELNENELNEGLQRCMCTSDSYSTKKSVPKSPKVRNMLKSIYKMLKNKRRKSTKKQKLENELYENEMNEMLENQNNMNEALDQRLRLQMKEAEEGAAITVCLDGQMTVVPVIPGQYYVPVHFAHTCAGDFYWTTLNHSDRDFYYKERAFSQHQVPEMQVAY